MQKQILYEKISSMGFLFPIFVSFIGVTLDLITTRIGLSLGYRELMPFGGTVFQLLAYPISIGLTVLFYFGFQKTKYKNIGRPLLFFIVGLPYLAVINNILVMSL